MRCPVQGPPHPPAVSTGGYSEALLVSHSFTHNCGRHPVQRQRRTPEIPGLRGGDGCKPHRASWTVAAKSSPVPAGAVPLVLSGSRVTWGGLTSELVTRGTAVARTQLRPRPQCGVWVCALRLLRDVLRRKRSAGRQAEVDAELRLPPKLRGSW